jgi:cell division protein FtsB
MDGLARSLRWSRLLLALLTATATLSGGTQALAPTPALAMDNQGNECQNLPTWERTVCEMENGGGSGAGGTNGGPDGPIVGTETIEIHDTAPPSRCTFCLPPQVGGGHLGFLDRGGKNPREPRHRGRPVRVGQVERGKPTKEECERLKDRRLQVPSEREMREVEDRIVSTDQNQGSQEEKLSQLRAEAEQLAQEVQALKKRHAPSKDVLAAEERHRAALRSILAMESEIRAIAGQFVRLVQDHQDLQTKRDAEVRPLRKQCKDRHHISI